MVDDVQPDQCWAALQNDPPAQLVDVRTSAEWTFVGVPDLSATGKQPALVAWQRQPGAGPDPDFIGELGRAGVTPDQPLYFICRSGARSLSAAQAARSAGFRAVFNVADGFEGPADQHGHRGTVAGWKASGLPWRQG